MVTKRVLSILLSYLHPERKTTDGENLGFFQGLEGCRGYSGQDLQRQQDLIVSAVMDSYMDSNLWIFVTQCFKELLLPTATKKSSSVTFMLQVNTSNLFSDELRSIVTAAHDLFD